MTHETGTGITGITIIIQALAERNDTDAEALRKKIVSQRDEPVTIAPGKAKLVTYKVVYG